MKDNIEYSIDFCVRTKKLPVVSVYLSYIPDYKKKTAKTTSGDCDHTKQNSPFNEHSESYMSDR